MAHITGGGIPENLPRAFAGRSLEAIIETGSWREPEIFDLIRSRGVDEKEMRGTFNMGIGFAIVVPDSEVDVVLSFLDESGEMAWRIGSIRPGDNGICYA
jgi:phosphoribosylformylglycinamidine cyclo-ligase